MMIVSLRVTCVLYQAVPTMLELVPKGVNKWVGAQVRSVYVCLFKFKFCITQLSYSKFILCDRIDLALVKGLLIACLC